MPVRYSDESAGPSTRRALAAEDEAVAELGDVGDYGTMSKAELVAEAEAQGLPVSGTKADLIERLTA